MLGMYVKLSCGMRNLLWKELDIFFVACEWKDIEGDLVPNNCIFKPG